jgi:hypothetical protein
VATIVVGGTGKHCGKTALKCGLIAALAEFRWTAVKITSHEHGKLNSIWEETAGGQATDTARYLAAGARRALLVSVGEGELGRVFPDLMEKIEPDADVIFESNRILEFIKPHVCLMVNGGDEQISRKESFDIAVQYADAMVIRSDSDRVRLDSAVRADEDAKPIFHLADLEVISPQMLAWVRLKLSGRI